MSELEDQAAIENVRHAMRRSISTAPIQYDALRSRLLRLYDACREEIAQALQPAINLRVSQAPHTAYEEKKKLALWINSELRSFGLAARYDNHACMVQANPGRSHGVGRFRLAYLDDNGHRRNPVTSTSLLPLELMPDPGIASRHRGIDRLR